MYLDSFVIKIQSTKEASFFVLCIALMGNDMSLSRLNALDMAVLEQVKKDTSTVIQKIEQRIEGDKIAVFDPRIKFASKKQEQEASVVWSTKSIELAMQAIEEGQGLRISPFLKSDPNLRKANLLFQYTDEEISEILKCRKDILYFAEKYVYLKTEKGLRHIKLRPYQKRMLAAMQNNRWVIELASRQIGKTTTVAIFFAHLTIFNTDKTAAIIAQRDQIAGEIFRKVKSIIKYLPFFMKPGCLSFNKASYSFDNGCSALYRPASIDAMQGYTLDVIFWDEAAYVRNTQSREFWNNVYPTLSSMSNSRVIICSTPNGRNLFWELWNNAIEGKNLFKTVRVDWWEVPGRDEAWRQQEIANLGSEAAFAQQYGLSFDVGVKNSLSADTFHYLNKVSTEFEHDIFKIGTDWDEYFRWSTKWMYNLRKDWFLISVDIGEGLGGDYSVIKIRKLFLNPDGTVIMPTVGVFECNTIIVEDFAKVILLMMKRFNSDHVRLIIERNSYGDLLIKDIDSLSEHLSNVDIPVETFAKFRRSADNMKMEKGIRLNRGNKKIAVGNWKKLVDDKIFIETDSRTIDQYREFGEDKNGNYKAGIGHDDLVMPDVNAAFYVKSNNTGWNEFIDDFKEHVTIDSFNVEIMIRYNLVAINEIKKDSAFDGNEYEIIPLEDLDDEEAINEYSEIDKYLDDGGKKKKSKKLKEYESYNEYDMINEVNIQLQERKRNKSDSNLSREELINKIAQELV